MCQISLGQFKLLPGDRFSLLGFAELLPKRGIECQFELHLLDLFLVLLLRYDLFEQSHCLILALEVLKAQNDWVVVGLCLLTRDFSFGSCGLGPCAKFFAHALQHVLRVHLALVHVDFVSFFIAHCHVLSLDVLSEVLEIIFKLEDCIVPNVKIFREFLFDLFSHVFFHQVVVVF